MHHHDTHPTDHDSPRGPRGRREHRPLDPEASELELIQHLARHLRRGSAVETAPWGLSPHQARALGVIARSETHGRGRRGRGRSRGSATPESAAPTAESAVPAADQATASDQATARDAASQPHGRGLRLGALAEWLHIAPRSATEVVDGLEELGLVERTPDPADRRAVLVALTDQGRTVAREIRAARKAQTETILDVLSEQDRAQLRSSLLALLEAAGR